MNILYHYNERYFLNCTFKLKFTKKFILKKLLLPLFYQNQSNRKNYTQLFKLFDAKILLFFIAFNWCK